MNNLSYLKKARLCELSASTHPHNWLSSVSDSSTKSLNCKPYSPYSLDFDVRLASGARLKCLTRIPRAQSDSK